MTVTLPIRPRAINSPVAEAVTRVSIFPLSIQQYHRIIDEKIVPEESTTELLRGVIIRKDRSSPGEDPMAHSPLHRLVVSLLTGLTARINTDANYLQIQLPVACPPDGAPEPDGAIIRGNPREYAERLPGPGDVLCVIEVAHSSLERDREDKLPIYAAAGVPQYVIVNLLNNTVELYTDPDPSNEQYRTRATFERGQSVSLQLPGGGFELAVADILP